MPAPSARIFSLAESSCSLCARPGPFAPFAPGASLRETRCPGCGSSRRTRDLVRVLLEQCLPGRASARNPDCDRPEQGAAARERSLREGLPELAGLRILELQAQGPLHQCLRGLPGYQCSEYFAHIAPGQRSAGGVLCQDATALTFADASFDLVISQDVLEHIEQVWLAFAQIQRVLAPGGRHLFTVPLHEGRNWAQRSRRAPGGYLEHMLPPVHHKDPLNPEGALVFHDFGDDLPQLLAARGIRARLAGRAPLYPPDKLCCIAAEEDYERYLKHRAQGSHAMFFLYNSNVFMAVASRFSQENSGSSRPKCP
ncbi:class I SAM-dependent methyltransferase [Desulfovibrio sp. OttesenSCG-928-A18]|nr:class I SAM-dependent methyltransferase [Desulfovibrio sp. OttesenSCG-928-A18]